LHIVEYNENNSSGEHEKSISGYMMGTEINIDYRERHEDANVILDSQNTLG